LVIVFVPGREPMGKYTLPNRLLSFALLLHLDKTSGGSL